MTSPSAIPVFRPSLPPTLAAELSSCLESRWWSYGPRCADLESLFTAGRGGWALATSSCTAALHVAGLAVRRGAGDEVLVPAMTFVSTAMAFQTAGLRPVPIDVRPETLLLDDTLVTRHVTSRTRAVVAVHLYGQRLGLAGLRALCDERGLALIEDCAHRIGPLDEPLVGDFACYSFNSVKEAPAGEGGLLWGRDPRLEPGVREATNLGMCIDTIQRVAALQHLDYEFGCSAGEKLRMSDIAATFVLACLPHRESWLARRRTIFRTYESSLQAPGVRPLPRRDDDSYLMFVVRVARAERHRVRAVLAAAGIATSTHYPSLSRHPLWRDAAAPCPIAEQAEEEILTLPCFAELDEAAQRRVMEVLNGV